MIRGKDRYRSLLPEFDQTEKCEQDGGRRSAILMLNGAVRIEPVEHVRHVESFMSASVYSHRSSWRDAKEYSLAGLIKKGLVCENGAKLFRDILARYPLSAG